MNPRRLLEQALHELGQASCLAHFEHRTDDDEIAAHWELDSPEQLCGEFSVLGLQRALTEKPHDHPLENELTPAEHQRWSELRPFDGHPQGGTGEWVALRVGASTPELWYYHPETTRENFAGFRLDLDHDQYLRALAITKGTYGWQTLFCDTAALDEDDLSYVRPGLEEMLALFPSLFPDHDYGPLRARLAERS